MLVRKSVNNLSKILNKEEPSPVPQVSDAPKPQIHPASMMNRVQANTPKFSKNALAF